MIRELPGHMLVNILTYRGLMQQVFNVITALVFMLFVHIDNYIFAPCSAGAGCARPEHYYKCLVKIYYILWYNL